MSGLPVVQRGAFGRRDPLAIGPAVPDGIQLCQLAAEFVPVLDLYRQEQPQSVLEIGTANGGTLYHWLQNAQPQDESCKRCFGKGLENQDDRPGILLGERGEDECRACGGTGRMCGEVRVVTVDLPNPDYPSAEHLYRDWTPTGVTVTQIRGDSRDPATVETARMLGPYQWLFIDACHEYEYTLADWTNYAPLVQPGGVVLFHDIALRRDYGGGRSAGVHQLWRELQADGYWTCEFRADPALQAYGIGALRTKESERK